MIMTNEGTERTALQVAVHHASRAAFIAALRFTSDTEVAKDAVDASLEIYKADVFHIGYSSGNGFLLEIRTPDGRITVDC